MDQPQINTQNFLLILYKSLIKLSQHPPIPLHIDTLAATTVNGGGDDTSVVLRRTAATATNSSEDSVLPSHLNLRAFTQNRSAVESSYLKHGSEHSQRKFLYLKNC